MHKKVISFLKLYKYLVISGLAVVGIIALLIITPRPCYNDGFRNLSELQEYAKTIDEFIKIENDNHLFPSYENYYQKNYGPSVWRTIQEKLAWFLCTLGLKKKPIFSLCFFKNVLETVTKQRQEKGWFGDFIQKIEVTPSSKFVVFGPVQGAYHNLVRYLEKLKELNIIDENLRIQHPQYYLIFLGNVVDHSAYTLEIFSIILQLLEKNPQNIIYLKGTHEMPLCWRQNTLRRELEIRAAKLSKDSIPLEKEVDHFFATLPITLYCTIPFPETKITTCFKLSAYVENKRLVSLLQEALYPTFLNTPNKQNIEYWKLTAQNNAPDQSKNINMKAIVTGIKKREAYEEMDGLRLMNPIDGVTTWTVLSNPIEAHRKYLKFFYDAFVIITPAPQLKDWRITLYNRDIRHHDRTFKTRECYFFSGADIN